MTCFVWWAKITKLLDLDFVLDGGSNYKDWIQPGDDNSPSVRHKHVIISVDCLY